MEGKKKRKWNKLINKFLILNQVDLSIQEPHKPPNIDIKNSHHCAWKHKNMKQRTELTLYKRVESGFFSSSTQYSTEDRGWGSRKGAKQTGENLRRANPFWIPLGLHWDRGWLLNMKAIQSTQCGPTRVLASAKEEVLSWTPVKVEWNFEIIYTRTRWDKHTHLRFKTDVSRDHIHLPNITVDHLPTIKNLKQFICRNPSGGFRHICPPEIMFSQEWWQKTSL